MMIMAQLLNISQHCLGMIIIGKRKKMESVMLKE